MNKSCQGPITSKTWHQENYRNWKFVNTHFLSQVFFLFFIFLWDMVLSRVPQSSWSDRCVPACPVPRVWSELLCHWGDIPRPVEGVGVLFWRSFIGGGVFLFVFAKSVAWWGSSDYKTRSLRSYSFLPLLAAIYELAQLGFVSKSQLTHL